jgi:protein-tyrosine-phosphatase
MGELGVDLSDREPREIPTGELNDCDLVVTMGCSTLSLETDVEVRDWALDDPDGQDLDAVRAIRDDIRERVSGVFDDIEARLESTA